MHTSYCSGFSDPQMSSVLNNRTLPSGCTRKSSWVTLCIASQKLACHSGGDIFIQNIWTKFKVCRCWGFFLQLESLVCRCFQGCLHSPIYSKLISCFPPQSNDLALMTQHWGWIALCFFFDFSFHFVFVCCWHMFLGSRYSVFLLEVDSPLLS